MSLRNHSGVYLCITPGGYLYVGSTERSFKQRWQEHERALKAGTHHNKRLQAEWSKHRGKGFRWLVVEVVNDRTRVVERERWHAQRYATANSRRV